MLLAFYLSGAVALLATLRLITTCNPIHALLYLVISLLAMAMIFFCIGAPFAGALQIIVYAGAIMVLFVFAVMMLNLSHTNLAKERAWLNPSVWIGPSLLALLLLALLVYVMMSGKLAAVGIGVIDAKQVGIALYGPYLLAVELASVLLLAALVVAYHLGRVDEKE